MQTSVPLSLPGRLGGLYDPSAAGLLPHVAPIRTHSRAEAKASVERIFFSHNLGAMHDSRDVDFMLKSCVVSGTSFNYIRYGVDIDVSAHADEVDRYIMVAPLSGDCVVKYLGRDNYVQPGGFIILKPNAPFDFSMSKDHSHIAVGIHRPALISVMTRHFGAFREPRKLLLPATQDTGDAEHTIMRFLGFVCEQLGNPAFASARNPFAKIIEDTFISLLSEFMAGAAPHRNLVDRTPRHVLLAEKFMRENMEEDITAEDVVAAAEVPMRTLYHSFRKYRGVSPLSWIKTERLKAARRALLDARDGGRTVTEVATLYCNSNLGRFSREYRREFGEYPSDTLHRGNAGAA